MLLGAVTAAWYIFWPLTVVALIIILACEETERDFLAFATLCAYLFVAWKFMGLDWIGYAREHTGQMLLIILGYFVAGLIWAVVKWVLYVIKMRSLYRELKCNFLKQKKVEGEEIPAEYKDAWKDFFERSKSRGYREESIPATAPRISDHKARFARWMTYWPMSMIWTVLADLVKDLFNAIFEAVKGGMQSISDKIYGDTTKDFE